MFTRFTQPPLVPAYALATTPSSPLRRTAPTLRVLQASCAFPVSFIAPESSERSTPQRPQRGWRVALTEALRDRATPSRERASDRRAASDVAPVGARPAANGLAARWKQRLNAGLDWLDRYWERRDEEHSTRYHGGW